MAHGCSLVRDQWRGVLCFQHYLPLCIYVLPASGICVTGIPTCCPLLVFYLNVNAERDHSGKAAHPNLVRTWSEDVSETWSEAWSERPSEAGPNCIRITSISDTFVGYGGTDARKMAAFSLTLRGSRMAAAAICQVVNNAYLTQVGTNIVAETLSVCWWGGWGMEGGLVIRDGSIQ